MSVQELDLCRAGMVLAAADELKDFDSPVLSGVADEIADRVRYGEKGKANESPHFDA